MTSTSHKPGADTPLAPFRLVADAAAWDACLADLRGMSRLAIDLEANSMFAYTERACLIQLSTATADYIIDLGPEGGDRGGEVLATGTPEEVAQVARSYTGQYLQKALAW